VDAGFEEAERQFSRLVDKYKAPSSLWLETIEAELGPDGRKLLLQLMQGHVKTRGDGNVGPSVVTSTGDLLTHRRLITRKLQTMFGEISIERISYSSPDNPGLFPLDAALNLPPSLFSAGIHRFIARRVSKMPFAEVLDLLHGLSGVTIAPPQALEIVRRCAVDFEEFYEAREKQPGDGRHNPILVLTTDGKGIVMRPEGLREETRERAKNAEPAMNTRLAPGEKANRKRMAQVASIYAINRFVRTTKDIIDEFARRAAKKRRPRPSQKRVWASVEKDADAVIKAMFAEAHKRDPKHRKEWVILVDGNKHQLRLVKALAKKEGVDAVVILDIVHVIEYLWDAARTFHDDKDHRGCEQWVEEQLERILDGNAGKVAGTIRLQAAKRKLTKAQAETARGSARYVARYKTYMKYNYCLKRGYPIATGVIEGACRHLIKDRMDVTGARWSLEGAEAVLKLRSLVASGDFDEYWTFHRNREHQRNHLSKFGNLKQLLVLQRTKSTREKSEKVDANSRKG
jgi:hypothetical protein